MGGRLNNSTWPVVLSLIVAGICVAAAMREHRLRSDARWAYLWPTFWWITAAVLTVLAIGQAGDFGELVADVARRDAVANDWYERRRWAQRLIVALIAAAWCVTTLIAIWRVPERRRRYLPMAIIVFSLICFGAIRIISLHQIDTIVYRRQILGAEVGRIIELIALSAVFVVGLLGLTVTPPTLDAPLPSEDADRMVGTNRLGLTPRSSRQ